MYFWKQAGRNSKSSTTKMKQLRFEQLEDKRLLAIMWANEFDNGANDPLFNLYGADEATARVIVNRAIDDWEAVVTDFNYDGDNNPTTVNALSDTFQLTVRAAALSSATRRGETFFATVDANGLPAQTTIRMDDNGGGEGWFFDTTPLDDIEFTGIADAFQASFIDAATTGQADQNDFYRTIVHEIGHALGITSNPNAAIEGMLTSTGITDPTGLSTRVLETFASTRANPQFGVQATFIGGHLYEGSANDPGGLLAHPNELMNPGRTVPAGKVNGDRSSLPKTQGEKGFF